MPYVLGAESKQKLTTVDPRLARVVERAIQISTVDFKVLEGVRTKRRQYELYAQGRQVGELRKIAGFPLDILAKPGEPKVTWTLNSRHFADPNTGLSKAVDLVPYPVDWNDLKKFDAIAEAMFAAAKELNVRLRWGADWDQDGKRRERGESDSPHFEVV